VRSLVSRPSGSHASKPPTAAVAAPCAPPEHACNRTTTPNAPFSCAVCPTQLCSLPINDPLPSAL
jgi:hypothetical protein